MTTVRQQKRHYKEAPALRAQCSTRTLDRALSRGELPYRRDQDGRVSIAADDLSAWIRTRQQPRKRDLAALAVSYVARAREIVEVLA